MIGLRKADFDRFSLNGVIFIMMVAQCFRDHRFVKASRPVEPPTSPGAGSPSVKF